jgi:hypothetical protein
MNWKLWKGNSSGQFQDIPALSEMNGEEYEGKKEKSKGQGKYTRKGKIEDKQKKKERRTRNVKGK